MSCPIDWTMRIKRKDGKPISCDEIEMLFNREKWEDLVCEDGFTDLDGRGREWEASFSTRSLLADEDIRLGLCKHSADYPEYLFQTERSYSDGEYYRTNFCDGDYEVMKGYIAYDPPRRVSY